MTRLHSFHLKFEEERQSVHRSFCLQSVARIRSTDISVNSDLRTLLGLPVETPSGTPTSISLLRCQVQSCQRSIVFVSLRKMRGPTNLAQRTDVLKRLVEYWHGPIGSNDGFTEDELTGLHIPTALRAWYLWAGKRREIMSGQNFLLLPKHDRGTYGGLYQKDGRLICYQENQCVYQWATLEDGDDPPVYGRYDDADPWTEEGISVSEHLILACLFEAILGHCRYGASVAWLREDKVTEIATSISPLAIAPWRWNYPMRFYGRNGAFMYTASNGEAAGEKGMSVWIGAETEHPLQFLRTYLDKGWEYVSV